VTGNQIPAAEWARLGPGTELMIVKLGPDGQEATRYPGRVLAQTAPPGWLATNATWTHGEMNLDGLWIRPGDTIDEYFSATAWFNAFAVIAPSGEPRGWYANVTYPATIALDATGPTLFWHDLYVDVIILPNGVVTVRDEDELAASGLVDDDQSLHQRILASRDLILRSVQARAYPFDQCHRRP
jgi:hypothetical protein